MVLRGESDVSELIAQDPSYEGHGGLETRCRYCYTGSIGGMVARAMRVAGHRRTEAPNGQGEPQRRGDARRVEVRFLDASRTIRCPALDGGAANS